MRLWPRSLLVAAVIAAAVSSACAPEGSGGDDSALLHVITPESLPGPEGKLMIDLTLPGGAFALRSAADGEPVDLGRIVLVCPNGATMPMDGWLADQLGQLGHGPGSPQPDLIVVAADASLLPHPSPEDLVTLSEDGHVQFVKQSGPSDPADYCMTCAACADGAFLCVKGCGEDADTITTHP